MRFDKTRYTDKLKTVVEEMNSSNDDSILIKTLQNFEVTKLRSRRKNYQQNSGMRYFVLLLKHLKAHCIIA